MLGVVWVAEIQVVFIVFSDPLNSFGLENSIW